MKPFSYFDEAQRKRLAISMRSLPQARLSSYGGSSMLAIKFIAVILGVGLLLSLSSTFGTEEAFVLLAALFA
jgi:hypothetical protein